SPASTSSSLPRASCRSSARRCSSWPAIPTSPGGCSPWACSRRNWTSDAVRGIRLRPPSDIASAVRPCADSEGMRRLTLLLILGAAAVFASSAGASQVISTSTVGGLTLQLNDKGEALLTYTASGKKVHVLVWGAVNAMPTKPGSKQVAFQLDYS